MNSTDEKLQESMPENEQEAVETEMRETVEQEPEKEEVKTEKVKKERGKASKEIKKKDSEIEELKQALGETKDRFMRTVAEYDNYRKRTEKEKLTSSQNGMVAAIEKLLPAIDALEMAAGAESTDPEYKKGVTMTLQLFQNAMTHLGVTEMEAEGKEFDPNRFNAVMQDDSSDAESGTVTRVLQKGYMLGDRVVRHAMVCVAV